MRSVVWGLLYWSLSVFALLLLIHIFTISIQNYKLLYRFVAGLILVLLISLIKNSTLRYNLKWFATFTHELTHAFFSIIFLNKVSNFNASALGGGQVQYYGRGNHMISLSPYCIPVYSLLLIIFSTFLHPSFYSGMDVLIGCTLMFHYLYGLSKAKPWQDDIKKTGAFTSYGFISLFNVVFLGIFMLHTHYPGVRVFYKYIQGAYFFVQDWF